MHLVVNPQLRVVEIHNDSTGEVLSWNIATYDKTRFKRVEDPFREINRFIAHQSESFQQDLFNAYARAKEIVETVNEPRALRDRLAKEVAAIYDIATLDKITKWAGLHTTVRIPDSSVFDEPDPDHPEEGTYDRAAYYQLLMLAIAMELMIPIWGVYLEEVQRTSGPALKEQEAFKLLRDCKELLYSEAMEKLSRYVNKYLEGAPDPSSANLKGLTKERLPEWLLASVVVRRLAIGEVDATPDKGHLVSNIHTAMGGMIKDLDRKFGGAFKAVNVEDETSRDDGNTTIADLVMARQDLTAGQMMTYQNPIMNYHSLAKMICKDIDPDRVELCVRRSLARQMLTRSLFHESICEYVTHGCIAAEVIPRLDPHEFLVLSGVCQAVLWHWGHSLLAIYLTARALPLNSDTAGTLAHPGKLSPKLIDRLVQLFPFTQPAYAAPPSGDPDRKNNVAVKAAKALSADFSKHSLYEAECPDELWALYPHQTTTRRVTVSNELVESIVMLLIQVAEMEQ